MTRKLGRRHAPDDRDNLFLVRSLDPLPALDTLPQYRYYYARFQQDQTGDTCVANGWTHRLGDSPRTWPLSWLDSITQRRQLRDLVSGQVFDPYLLPAYRSPQSGQTGFRGLLYDQAQKVDEWSDTPPAGGTSVRAGAKVLQAWGFISEYRWLVSADEVLRAVLSRGPVVIGVEWYASWMSVPFGGSLSLKPGDPVVGGHCVVIDGANQALQRVRVQTWGGRFVMPMDALTQVIARQGEACLPIEVA